MVGRFHEDFVNVDMWRTAGHPDDDFGDIFGGQWIHAGINTLRHFAVAFETDHGKFRFRQAGINRADANAGAKQFVSQAA